ncbi:MAG: Gfo/Idh/MocA family oxidoreductase [Bacteroidota bacterium]|nr:Gfo/Idh/MocA family oxidoreductase [Bacteroidota bacterium]MDX5430006.1 Gfo/Idh/MocA family oxidoreductase [Bacteroidota bacterium]MDX5468779.1 Gfo/Idh/MocA family oxidoreductase [Bacteroidota bacterium]
MLRIGVIGAGHLGKIHIRCLKNIPEFDLVGFVDPDDTNASRVEEEYGLKRFADLEAMFPEVDAVDIVTPTVNHYDLACKAIKASKHVFIEKPLTHTLDEARELVDLGYEANVKIQVGHVERFNPAFLKAQEYDLKPLFIETHRLAEFNPRGTDVSVVLDLMIHDIDITLSMVRSNVKSIQASGVNVVSDTPDIANARIEFDNGCVANLTASRISMKNMRKTRVFQRDAYVAIDFLKKSCEVLRLEDAKEEEDPMALLIDLGAGKGKKRIHFENPESEPVNSIQRELELFRESIASNLPTAVNVQDGYDAMNIAYQIMEKIQSKVNIR